MKAWQLAAANEPLLVIEREDPRAGPGQVVVDVRAAGICHSDVGFLDGTLTWMLAKLPLVLGHEVAGVISEVGPGVEEWASATGWLRSATHNTLPGGRSTADSPTNSSARQRD